MGAPKLKHTPKKSAPLHTSSKKSKEEEKQQNIKDKAEIEQYRQKIFDKMKKDETLAKKAALLISSMLNSKK